MKTQFHQLAYRLKFTVGYAARIVANNQWAQCPAHAESRAALIKSVKNQPRLQKQAAFIARLESRPLMATANPRRMIP